jgi:hypothetical protein
VAIVSAAVAPASLGFGHALVLFGEDGMNAADQVRSVELASALAAVVGRFRRAFPAARANLTPWRDDPLTRAFDERESLDLSFHFPGWSPRLQCRSLLVQLRLERAPGTLAGVEQGETAAGGRPRLLGVLIRGLTYDAERWRLATVGEWRPSGSHLPQPEVVEQLRELCRELFDLFAAADEGVEGDRDEPGERAA